MTSRSILVTDTNIWIDLENGGILVEVFRLPYRFLVPDFAISELISPRWETLEVLGLEAQELDASLVGELIRLRQMHRSLSVVDLATFLLALSLHTTLLTGERRLNELASANGLTVHGVLWLLDEMVRFQVLAPAQAAAALRLMLDRGARLPVEECKQRIAIWTR
jgi:hypothetical protein